MLSLRRACERQRATPVARIVITMITIRKSTHEFPFLSSMGRELRLSGLPELHYN